VYVVVRWRKMDSHFKGIIRWVLRKVERYQDEKLASLSLPVLPDVPLLAVLEKGDEARLGLRLVRWITGVPFAGFAMGLNTAKLGFLAMILVIYALEIFLLLFKTADGKLPHWAEITLQCAGICMMLGMLFAILSQLFMPLFAVLRGWAFGPLGFRAALAVESSVVDFPGLQEWKAGIFKPVSLARGFYLLHTRIYEDEGVVRLVCRWLITGKVEDDTLTCKATQTRN